MTVLQTVRGGLGVVVLGLAIALPAVATAADHAIEARTDPFVFSPARLTIEVGDTVTWTVAPGDPHTVTSGTYNASGTHPDGLFDSGLLRPGGTFAHTFTAAGEVRYVCSIHADSGMIGTIVVVDPAAATEPGSSADPGPAAPSDDPFATSIVIVLLGVVLVIAVAARLMVARRRA